MNDLVRAGYDALGLRYRDWTSGSETRLRFLDLLLARLAPGSDVVELGCGPGEPVTRALATSHSVTAVDLSPAQLQLARRAAPAARFVEADVTELELPEASTDAVVAFYVLGHLPPDAHAPLFLRIARWLRPGGLMLLNTPAGANDGVDADWLGVPMYFGGLAPADTLAAVRSAGLAVEQAETVHEDAAFLWITATR